MRLGPNWSETSLLFGGAFDPPHLSHTQALIQTIAQLGIPRVWILPSGDPPLKTPHASAPDRMKMAQLAFGEISPSGCSIEFLDWEIKNPAQFRTTWDTLQLLKAQGTPIAVGIGSDQLLQFNKWHRARELLGQCHWVIWQRPGQTELALEEGTQNLEFSGWIKRIGDHLWQVSGADTTLTSLFLNINSLSSSEIRKQLARTGSPPPGTLSPAVQEYLMQRHLYGS